MKRKINKNKSFDTIMIELASDDSLIYPNCASMIKHPAPFFPDMNTTDQE